MEMMKTRIIYSEQMLVYNIRNKIYVISADYHISLGSKFGINKINYTLKEVRL